jgi:hypothetical protein
MGCRRLRAALAFGALTLGLLACTARSEPGAVTADAYVAALSEFLPDAAVANEDPPIVYVVPIGDGALDLDTQVAVIDALAERWDVHFVDDAQAAIKADDDDDDDAEPRGETYVLGIGTIKAVPPHTVRIEQYTDASRSQAHRVTLVEHNGTWRIDSVAMVEPEVLVGDG